MSSYDIAEALSRFEAAVDAMDCPIEVRTGVFNLATYLLKNGHAIKFNCEMTPGTNKVRVLAYPSERFLGLMAAVGAGE